MDKTLMPKANHSTSWRQPLAAGEVRRLPARLHARRLSVVCGRLWVTQTTAGRGVDDLWLGPGDQLDLPGGTAWVVEAWPESRARLTDLPGPLRRAFSAEPWRAAWRMGSLSVRQALRGALLV